MNAKNIHLLIDKSKLIHYISSQMDKCTSCEEEFKCPVCREAIFAVPK